jgi:hypothetical protein
LFAVLHAYSTLLSVYPEHPRFVEGICS